ncbi:unnamed protein product [Scytosiphon promiscuus]
MHAMRSAARMRARRNGLSRARFNGIGIGSAGTSGASPAAVKRVVATRGVSSSRSINKAAFLSALATLGASGATTASAFRASAFSSSSAVTLATSTALAVTLVMPQPALCWGGRREAEDKDEDDNSKGKGNGRGSDEAKALLKIARDALLGDGKDADGNSKARRGGKGDRGEDDTENAKELVKDLVDAFSGFGGEVTKAVDGAIKRKNKPASEGGLAEAVRNRLDELMNSGAPAQISFGFGMGVCCGFAAKKTAKVALVGAGLAFGSLQLLSYMGYIELDYDKIEGEVMGSLDLDKDGKVDTNDIQELWNRTMKVLSYNLPTGSGFVAGALLGARMG